MSGRADGVEKLLLVDILRGEYRPGDCLPGERELAQRCGVTRPTVRSALQRLARDGWIAVSERRASTVSDYWLEGNLNVLAAIARNEDDLDRSFISELLEVRLAVAPDYASRAVRKNHLLVVAALARPFEAEDPGSISAFDWQLHLALARLSGNRIYPLMLNSFAGLYSAAGEYYFSREECRRASGKFYGSLLEAAVKRDHRAAFRCTAGAMRESVGLWKGLKPKHAGGERN